jgi:uncharacterized protein YodC (DUF2158 family)
MADPIVPPDPVPNPVFALGDVVKLKSGGPSMTVQDIQKEPSKKDPLVILTKVHCRWFADLPGARPDLACFEDFELVGG